MVNERVRKIDEGILEDVMAMVKGLYNEIAEGKQKEVYENYYLENLQEGVKIERVTREEYLKLALENVIDQLEQHSYFLKKDGIDPEKLNPIVVEVNPEEEAYWEQVKEMFRTVAMFRNRGK